MFGGFSTGKCKTNCKLTVGRVKLMRNKKNLQLKQLRREVADLLRANKQDNARIRVEAVIQEQKMLRAYDIIEVFVELLAVRVELIAKSKDIPPDMLEAVSSVVYAAQRIQDFPELGVIRGLLGHKFGREYVAEASDDTVCRKWQVNENLRSVLAIDSPPSELKLQTLSEIAQEEGVEWDAHAASMDLLPSRPPALGPGYFGNGPPPGPPGSFGGGPGPTGPSGGFGVSNGENQYSAAAGLPPPTGLPGARGGQASSTGPPQGFANSGSQQGFGNNGSQQGFGNSSGQQGFDGRGPKPPPGGAGGNLPVPSQTQGTQFRQGPQQPGGIPQGGMPGPEASPEEWADAMAAANAARQYSDRARAAAEAAERHAATRGYQGGEAPSSFSADSAPHTGPSYPSQAPKSAFPQGGPPTLPPGGAPPVPPSNPQGPPAGFSAPPSLPQAPQNPDSSAPPGGGVNGYRQRSTEDIQRDYDAVPGYTKAAAGDPSAPSAPSAPPPAPQAPGAGEGKAPSEFEELTKRLEALRRNT